METHNSVRKDRDENIELWQKVCDTDPKFIKDFQGKRFRGSAINPMYQIKKATELWGPCGGNWGWTVLNENYVDGAPLFAQDKTVACKETIHTILIEFFYPHPTKRDESAKVVHSGATTVISQDKYGNFFSDEEHRKKSITDAVSKALSMLGFSSDIYLNGPAAFSDNKYTSRPEQEEVKGLKLPTLKSDVILPKLTPEQIAEQEVKDREARFQRAKNSIAAATTLEQLDVFKKRVGASKFTETQVADLDELVNAKYSELSQVK